MHLAQTQKIKKEAAFAIKNDSESGFFGRNSNKFPFFMIVLCAFSLVLCSL